MQSLISLWTQIIANRGAAIIVSGVVVGLGVLLIAVGELLDWGWTRIIGASVISLGSVSIGVLVGWSEPVRPRIASIFASWSRAIVVVLALIIVAPLLFGLLISFGGLIVGGPEAGAGLMLAGVLITISLLAVTLVTASVAISLALDGLWKSRPDATAESNGRSDE